MQVGIGIQNLYVVLVDFDVFVVLEVVFLNVCLSRIVVHAVRIVGVLYSSSCVERLGVS